MPIPISPAVGDVHSYNGDFAGDVEQDMEFGVGDGAETSMRGMHSATGSFEAWFDSEATVFPTLAPFVTDAPGSTTTDGNMVLTLDTGNTVTFPVMMSNVSYDHNRTGFLVVRGNFQSSGALT